MMVSSFQPRHALVVCVVALLATGIIMVTSAGLSVAPGATPTTALGILTSRNSIYAGLAILFLLLGCHLDLGRLFGSSERSGLLTSGAKRLLPVRSISASGSNAAGRGGSGPAISPVRAPTIFKAPAIYLLLGISVLLLLVYLPGIGLKSHGAARWIEMRRGGMRISMQPSEVAKWSMTVILPLLALPLGAQRIRRFWTGFLPLLAALGLICGLIINEDLGTAVLIGLVGMIVIWAAVVRWWHIAILLPIPIFTVATAILTSDYRMQRVQAFLNPYADPQNTGYHVIQSMAAISNGGATGRGLGHGVYKFGYLPEDTTDFLFSIICEEMGIAGAGLVLFLYAVILGSGLLIMRRLQNRGGQLIALGIILTVGIQASINLLVVTGMAPTKGIALPLLSAGGTGWIFTAFSLGLLVGMDRAQERRSWCVEVAVPKEAVGGVVLADLTAEDRGAEEVEFESEIVVLARQRSLGAINLGKPDDSSVAPLF